MDGPENYFPLKRICIMNNGNDYNCRRGAWVHRHPPPRKLQPENYLLSLISQLAKENASKKTFYTGPDPCYPI